MCGVSVLIDIGNKQHRISSIGIAFEACNSIQNGQREGVEGRGESPPCHGLGGRLRGGGRAGAERHWLLAVHATGLGTVTARVTEPSGDPVGPVH